MSGLVAPDPNLMRPVFEIGCQSVLSGKGIDPVLDRAPGLIAKFKLGGNVDYLPAHRPRSIVISTAAGLKSLPKEKRQWVRAMTGYSGGLSFGVYIQYVKSLVLRVRWTTLRSCHSLVPYLAADKYN